MTFEPSPTQPTIRFRDQDVTPTHPRVQRAVAKLREACRRGDVESIDCDFDELDRKTGQIAAITPTR